MCSQAITVLAATGNEDKVVSVERQYLDNGNYCEIVISEEASLFRSSSKTATKTSTFYNGKDEDMIVENNYVKK